MNDQMIEIAHYSFFYFLWIYESISIKLCSSSDIIGSDLIVKYTTAAGKVGSKLVSYLSTNKYSQIQHSLLSI